LDESEKPGTFWLSGPREDFIKQSMEDIKCTIIHERLLRGGDEDAKGYSFVHDALKIPPDDKLNLNVSNAYRCGTCNKAVPEVAELKTCKACRAYPLLQQRVSARGLASAQNDVRCLIR